MRFRRVRYTSKQKKIQAARNAAFKTRDGVSRLKRSSTGRALRLELVMQGWQQQNHLCTVCNNPILELSDAVLRDQEFPTGTIPPVVHARCRKAWAKSQSVCADHVDHIDPVNVNKF